MIVVWGKIVGLGLGVFGGPVGAAFGLLLGHLLDMIAAEFLLRRRMLNLLAEKGSLSCRQFRPRTALAALVTAAAAGPHWSPVSGDRNAFRHYSMLWDGPAPGAGLHVLWHRVVARQRSRYLDVGVSIRTAADRSDLVRLVGATIPTAERSRLLEIPIRTLDSDPRRSVRAWLRSFAESIDLPEEWIDVKLPAPPVYDQDESQVVHALAILGIDDAASGDDVKKVYRKLAAQFHPDTTSGLSTEQRKQSSAAFVRIRDAYELIMSRIEDQ